MIQPRTENHSAQRAAIRSPLLWPAIVVIAGLGLATAAGLYSSRMMQRTPAISAARLAAAQGGALLTVAVEITSVPSADLFDARLLDDQNGHYIRSSRAVQIRLQPNTQISMGRRNDLRPGAILQVSAVMQDPGRDLLVARRMVILTGYVQVR